MIDEEKFKKPQTTERQQDKLDKILFSESFTAQKVNHLQCFLSEIKKISTLI